MPKDTLISRYIKSIASEFLANAEIKLHFTMQFYKQYKAYAVTLNRRRKQKTACKLAAKKVVYAISSLRKSKCELLKYFEQRGFWNWMSHSII